ncbi:class I SAM-dependent rRNA methyltransferase [Enterococcus sp. LJL120]
MKIKVTQQAAKKIRRGYPLLRNEDLATAAAEITEWVSFVDDKNNFLGQGYLGQQNKGAGWIFSRQPEPLDQQFFKKIFSKAKELRHSFFTNPETTAFRLFNGEGDGLGGLTVDWYNGYGVFSWYNQSIYQHSQELIAAFQAVYPEMLGASEKIRFQSELPESRWLFGEEPVEPLLIKENGIQFATYLNEGLMTGIFLDQREVRNQLVEGFASGQTVLNMFSYTGAFSVAAAMGGALETTSVDLAKRSREKTAEQFMVNQIPPESQKIIVMDTFEFFKYALKKNLTYDVIILDPPSFARNKKKTFSVAKNYGDLISQSLAILNPGGRIIASTNAANVSSAKFQGMIEAAFTQAQRNFQLKNKFSLPFDFHVATEFPEGDYLKVLFYQVD